MCVVKCVEVHFIVIEEHTLILFILTVISDTLTALLHVILKQLFKKNAASLALLRINRLLRNSNLAQPDSVRVQNQSPINHVC